MNAYDSNVIMNSGYGRPSLSKLKNNYIMVDSIQDVDESFIGKEVIVIYKYPELLFGNYHQDILHYGIFSESPVQNYNTHIWIKNYKNDKTVCISKKRFTCENSKLLMFILKS